MSDMLTVFGVFFFQAEDGIRDLTVTGVHVCSSDLGRHYAITGRESYQEFRERVPIVDYDELAPWIERQASRGGAVVTAEPPLVYEQTSGSSGRRKLIPYTRCLLASFNPCFVVWAYDLLARG